MNYKNTTSKLKLLTAICLFACLLALALIAHWFFSEKNVYSTKQELPLTELDGKNIEVTAYQYLGSWMIPVEDGVSPTADSSWKSTIDLVFGKNRETFQIDSRMYRLRGTRSERLTPDDETETFGKIEWAANQVSLFAFRAFSPQKQVAVVEMDTNDVTAFYINGKLIREMIAVDNVEIGAHSLVPVSLKAGENIFVIKAFSSAGPPRLRMSLILDQSSDFQSAWNGAWGFLDKVICRQKGNVFEAPVASWDKNLNRMSVKAEVCDALTGNILMKKDELRNGNAIRDGGKTLGAGIYKITYKTHAPQPETASEYFIVGFPKEVYGTVRESLDALSWDAAEQPNIEAQTRRTEILFEHGNYDSDNKAWQGKIAETLGSLAEYIRLKKEGKGNVFKDLTGHQLRGYVSKIDNSKQVYQLFIPSNYTTDEKLPLLIIMPVTVSAKERSFIEGPSSTTQRQVVMICNFAEKFGFGVLCPGYRNAAEGWTYEAEHVEEALSDVEANYNIDSSKISLYGICSGGYYASRLASIYPRRYAAIVYDRAVFDREPKAMQRGLDSIREWIQATQSTDRIIANKNLKILVLNDGSMKVGHGEIELTYKFLKEALPKRPDIKYALGQRQMGVALWNLIFDFLRDCKNEHPSHVRVDVPAESGYAGPISEVLATPFIVVEGTNTSKEGEHFMGLAINNLQRLYKEKFYGAELPCKKDNEVTNEDIQKCSLVLLGNADSNLIWGKLASRYPDSLTPYNPPDNHTPKPSKNAFAEVFKNPATKTHYLLLMGADKLEDMASLANFNPFASWSDCYIYKNCGVTHDEVIIAHRP